MSCIRLHNLYIGQLPLAQENIKAIVPWEIVFSVVVEDLLLFFKVFDWFFVGVF